MLRSEDVVHNAAAAACQQSAARSMHSQPRLHLKKHITLPDTLRYLLQASGRPQPKSRKSDMHLRIAGCDTDGAGLYNPPGSPPNYERHTHNPAASEAIKRESPRRSGGRRPKPAGRNGSLAGFPATFSVREGGLGATAPKRGGLFPI